MTDAVRRVYEIARDGNFCKSSSASTVELHLEMREIMGSLAPCQLPGFLSHENSWVRLYSSDTVEFRLKIEKEMDSLAQGQLPEFLAHEDKWVRYYAEKRMRECSGRESV